MSHILKCFRYILKRNYSCCGRCWGGSDHLHCEKKAEPAPGSRQAQPWWTKWFIWIKKKKNTESGRAKADSHYDVCPDGKNGFSLLHGSQSGPCQPQGDHVLGDHVLFLVRDRVSLPSSPTSPDPPSELFEEEGSQCGMLIPTTDKGGNPAVILHVVDLTRVSSGLRTLTGICYWSEFLDSLANSNW